MRRFIWWLRSAFCKHDWAVLLITHEHRTDENGKQVSELPVGRVQSKECAKCGWIWRQRL